jgi:DNA-binding NtrC family response regulator
MSRHALIVDDNRSLAEDLGEILEAEGYSVSVFDDPQRALAESGDIPFDVALLDVRMPGIDGVSLHRALARAHPHARFVLMTAYTEDERVESALAAGVRAVLTKPVPLDRLLSALDDRRVEHILLVDDDRALGDALAELLVSSGYRCTLGRSIADARRLITEAKPDAVIVDVRLPDGSGTDLSVELARDNAVEVILITGFDPHDAERVLHDELQDRGRVLVKPFAPEAVLKALSELKGHAA